MFLLMYVIRRYGKENEEALQHMHAAHWSDIKFKKEYVYSYLSCRHTARTAVYIHRTLKYRYTHTCTSCTPYTCMHYIHLRACLCCSIHTYVHIHSLCMTAIGTRHFLLLGFDSHACVHACLDNC